MSKTALVVFSDPSAGEEALGRVFNAMFVAYEMKQKKQEAAIIFQGAGSRWPIELSKPEHPGHALYEAVHDQVVGVCGGCADVFGATEGLKATGLKLHRDIPIPGTNGILDLSTYLDGGYRVMTF